VYKEMTWKWLVKWPLPSSHLTSHHQPFDERHFFDPVSF
jgi:hypothetical protein